MLPLLALLLAGGRAAAREEAAAASAALALALDDECAADSTGQCSLTALQLRATKAAPSAAWRGSCAAYGCGHHFHPTHLCQCNSACQAHGNCCSDYLAKCTATPLGGSCAAYGCVGFDGSHSCQCNPDCTHHGNCCADYRALCVLRPWPEAPSDEPSKVSATGAMFKCTSDLDMGPVVRLSQKGLALDDDTFKGCPGSIPAYFPNTDGAVQSLRLFKAWDPEWPPEGRLPAWEQLAGFVHASGAKVFLGTEITCNVSLDLQSWEWAKQLLAKLGPSHVMGLGIGNELELLYNLGDRRKVAPVTKECVDRLWRGGYVLKTFKNIVKEFDALGFGSVPVTSVLGGYALAGKPFVDTAASKINTFVTALTRKYGKRFIFAFNFYPYFDTNMHLDRGGAGTCKGALRAATSWSHRGFVPSIFRAAKERVEALAPGSKVWLAETGWSAPYAPSLASEMRSCAEWSSLSTLRSFYSGFLQWDMSGTAPDHVFYFTMRNSKVFGIPEFFGLVSDCATKACKLQSSTSVMELAKATVPAMSEANATVAAMSEANATVDAMSEAYATTVDA